MTEWRGLHNPDRHEAYTVAGANPCIKCDHWCDSEYPCRCCLAAEVERLTGELAESERLLKWWVVQGMVFAQLVNRQRDRIDADVQALRGESHE